MPRKAKEEEVLEQEAPRAQAGETSPQGLYAYDDFELRIGDDVFSFKKGDRFTAPLGWERSPEMDVYLHSSKQKSDSRTGLAFQYQGKVLNPNEKNPDLRERQVHTAVLPLEER